VQVEHRAGRSIVTARLILFLAAGYVSALLVVAGAGHALRLGAFVETLRRHAIVVEPFAAPAAACVAVAETVLGAGLLAAVLAGNQAAAMRLFAACGLLAAIYVGYLVMLLKRKAGGSCGCLPVAAPLTEMSLLPAAGILCFSALGMLAALADPIASQGVAVLGLAWGVLLSLLSILLPATMPRPVDAAPID
jgi:hypothetical protein